MIIHGKWIAMMVHSHGVILLALTAKKSTNSSPTL